MLLTGSIDVTELEDNRNNYMKKLEEKKKAAWDGTSPAGESDKRKIKDLSDAYMQGGDIYYEKQRIVCKST